MSFLLFSNPHIFIFPFSSASYNSLSSVSIATPVSRFRFKPIDGQPEYSNRVGFQKPIFHGKTGAFIVNTFSDVGGMPSTGNSELSGESKDEVVPVDKLPLESKLQERMEQKIKMKIAKKIRLRRKRLLRKRRMRKKGRWPPSKMKKLKNV